MNGSYLTGLGGQALSVPVPTGLPYAPSLTYLNTRRTTDDALVDDAPPLDGLNVFLTEWALKLSSGAVPTTLVSISTEVLPKVQGMGTAYTAEATAIHDNLRVASQAAKNIVNQIVRLRQLGPDYAASRWRTDGPTITVPVRDSNKALLDHINEKRATWGSIFRSKGSVFGAGVTFDAVLNQRQHTEYQFLLWWQTIEKAVDNMRPIMTRVQMKQERVPEPDLPAIPVKPKIETPDDSTQLVPTLMGISLVGAIGWWYVRRRRVKSL
jgi:LPXTG-motif cell wall-anchored protein